MFCDSSVNLQVVAHLYRGEMNRLTVYRQRLDILSNWSIMVITAMSTIYLTNQVMDELVIFILIIPLLFFSWSEARRYRYYRLSVYRVRLLERGFYAHQIFGSPENDYDCTNTKSDLIHELLHPTHRISLLRSWLVRLHRNYIWALYFLPLCWIVKHEENMKKQHDDNTFIHTIYILYSVLMAIVSLFHVFLFYFDYDSSLSDL